MQEAPLASSADLTAAVRQAVEGQLEGLGAQLQAQLRDLTAELRQAVREELQAGAASPGIGSPPRLPTPLRRGRSLQEPGLKVNFSPFATFKSEEAVDMMRMIEQTQRSKRRALLQQQQQQQQPAGDAPSPKRSASPTLQSTGDVAPAPALPGLVAEPEDVVAVALEAAKSEKRPRQDSQSTAATAWSDPSLSRSPSRKGSLQTMEALEEEEGSDYLSQRSSTRHMSRKSTRRRTGGDFSMAERAMGVLPSGMENLASEVLAQESSESRNRGSALRQRAQRFVESNAFETASLLIMTLTVMHVGFTTDYMARHMLTEMPDFLRVLDVVLFLLYAGEVGTRAFGLRRRFFTKYGWAWNVLDVLFISLQAIEELLQLLAAGAWMPGSLLRVVRMLRSVRAVRVLHVMRFARDLQMLVSCLLRCLRTFFWSLVLIFMILFVAAIYLVQLVTSHRLERQGEKLKGLEFWFDVPGAVLALFQGLTGGLDWALLTYPLMDISPVLGVTLTLFIAFMLVLVLNVVSATFVETAIQRATKVREIQKMATISNLFRSIDMDGSGSISCEELESKLDSSDVQDFFQTIDVDVLEVQRLFELMDADKTGRIEFDEFLDACLRLNGPAKSIDTVMAFHHLHQSISTLTHAEQPAAPLSADSPALAPRP